MQLSAKKYLISQKNIRIAQKGSLGTLGHLRSSLNEFSEERVENKSILIGGHHQKSILLSKNMMMMMLFFSR